MNGEEKESSTKGKSLADLIAIKPETITYCPRCQSEHVEEVIIEKTVERMSMDDIGKVGTSEHIPITYRLTCENCKYYQEYTI